MPNLHINIKQGVYFKRLAVPVLKIIETTISVWAFHDLPAPTLTSANDSNHMNNSLHYKDMAIDLRTKNLTTEQLSRARRTLEDALGASFDVVVEPTHLHIEHDPK